MKKVIDTHELRWDIEESWKELLGVESLPRYIIIETVEA